MHQGKPSSSNLNSRNPQRPRSASASNLLQNQAARDRTDSSGTGAEDAALLADFGMLSSQEYYPSMAPLSGFYGNFMHHDNEIPPQSSSPTSVNYHWHTAAAPPRSESSINQFNVPQASSSMNPHPSPLSYFESPHGSFHHSEAISRGQQAQASTAASNSNSSSQEVDLTEAERAASDEKRRRNTAASARFRVKKKHKTIALERTVSDLTGRAEELEREVGNLRQENGWLKEIVVLKGAQNVANNRLASSQSTAFEKSRDTESTAQEEASEGSLSALSDDDIPVKRSKGKERSNKKS